MIDPVKRLPRNVEGRDLIVGDIHGCASKLDAALERVGFDVEVDRLICVGDLVDRGPESDAMVELLHKPWLHSVRGNHEQMAISLAAGEIPMQMYLANGGAWNAINGLAERRLIADAFEALPLAIELETAEGLVVVLHAELPALRSWAECRALLMGGGVVAELAATMQWGRSRFNAHAIHGVPTTSFDRSRVSDVRSFVVGHTPVREPLRLGDHLYIDTGAWLPEAGPRLPLLINAETLQAEPARTAKD